VPWQPRIAAENIQFRDLCQGLTLSSVVRTSGLSLDPAHLAAKESQVRTWLSEAALNHLDGLRETTNIPDQVLGHLRRRYTARLGAVEDGAYPVDAFANLQRDLLDVQRGELRRLHADGRISDTVHRTIQHELDRSEAGIVH
jgi:hypothetical protein